MKIMMNILTIQLNKLKETGLTLDGYIILQLLYNNEINTALSLFEYERFKQSIVLLEKMSYIKYLGDINATFYPHLLELRFKAIDLFKVNDTDKQWLEFKLTYPRKDGNRPLHNDVSKCEVKYKEIVKNNLKLHETIIKAIGNEVSDRKIASYKREFRPAWKLLSTYINQKGWEMYIDWEDDSKALVERVESI